MVLVGLDSITGLQSARIYHGHGIPVLGLTSDAQHWAARTRTCAEIVEAPMTGERLLAALHALAARWPGPSVLVPCTDAAVDFLSRHRADLPDQSILPLGPHRVIELLADKARFAEYAEKAGFPVPRTATLRSRADAERVAPGLAYPSVLKPSVKSARWLAHTSTKAFTVHNAEALLTTYNRVGGWAPELVVQEWVSGAEDGLFSCNAYFDIAGVPLATFVARKVRQWPPEVGTSASGVECRNDEVLHTTVKLFGELGFRGLAYLEMKRSDRTGRLVVIEPNVGRPTGRSAIAEAGGVDLLLTAYRDALDLPPLALGRQQTYGQAAWIDVRRDLQAAVVARRKGTITMTAWLRWLLGPKAHAIWSTRDPMPFVVDIWRVTVEGLTSGLRSLRRTPPPFDH